MILRPLLDIMHCQKAEWLDKGGCWGGEGGGNLDVPFVADGLPRVVAFAPPGRLGGLFFEPGFELLGSHVDELVELSVAELAGLWVT